MPVSNENYYEFINVFLFIFFFQQRGIKLATLKESGETEISKALTLKDLEGHNPGGAKVHMDEDGFLNWPVLFLYPEYSQSDFIERFCESSW